MKRSRSIFVLSLLLLTATLVGVALRIRFAAEPLWIDELHTAWAIDTNLGEIAVRAGQGNQSPVYFWTSWLACQVFGVSEFVLRLPSVFFSSATILLAAIFVWRFTEDAMVSGTIAILVSIDSWFIFYGSEARPYALVQMLSILQVGCLARELDRDYSNTLHWIRKPVSWPLILLTSAMIATHLTAILLVAAELLFVLAFVKPLSRNRIVLSLILSCLVIFPLFPTLVSAYEKRADWKPISDNSKLLQDAAPSLLVYLLFPVICLLGCRAFENNGFPKWTLRNLFKFDPDDRRSGSTQDISRHKSSTDATSDADRSTVTGRVVGLTLFWGLGPLTIVWLLESVGTIPLAAYRYTTAGSVAFPIFAGLAIAAIRKMKLRLLICLVVLLTAAGINPIFHSRFLPIQHAHYRSEDWKSAIEHLGQTLQSGNQPVFLFANLVEDHRARDVPFGSPLSEYLKFPLTGIYKLPDRPEIIPMPTHAATRWNSNHLELILRFQAARIIARVTMPEMQTVVDELQAFASANSVEIDCEIYVQPGNVIKTAFISCRN